MGGNGAERRTSGRAGSRFAASVAIAFLAMLLPAASPLPVAAVSATSALSWTGTALDPISQGTTGTLAEPAGSFVMFTSGSNIARVDISQSAVVTWSFVLLTGSEDELVAGTYAAVAEDGPSLLIQGKNTNGYCIVIGSFTVLDIVHTPGTGEVTSLAARVSGHCQGSAGTFTADLRYASAVGYALPAVEGSSAFDPVPYSATGQHDITIRSAGTGPLLVSGITLTGPNAASFAISDETCTDGPIAAGASCVVSLTFTPMAQGVHTATLQVTSDAADPTLDITVTGTGGLPVAVSPPSLDFGAVVVGQPSASESLTFSNGGTVSIELGAVEVNGPDAAHFHIVGDACSSVQLAGGASCEVGVQFVPTSATPASAWVGLGVSSPAGFTGSTTATLAGTGVYEGATMSRSALHNAAPAYTWNSGGALARTSSSLGTYLHAVSESSRVGSASVKDTGPYAPVIYTKSSTGGATWTAGTRLNSTSQHGVWPGVAGYGSYVYASWVKVAKVRAFSTGAARYIMFRSNTHAGSGTWATAKRLTSSTGRVDYPQIAASGANVYIAYTDANSGDVKVLISHNRGSTWTTFTVGSTSASSGSGGRTGLPSIAAVGSSVIVSWISNSSGAVPFEDFDECRRDLGIDRIRWRRPACRTRRPRRSRGASVSGGSALSPPSGSGLQPVDGGRRARWLASTMCGSPRSTAPHWSWSARIPSGSATRAVFNCATTLDPGPSSRATTRSRPTTAPTGTTARGA